MGSFLEKSVGEAVLFNRDLFYRLYKRIMWQRNNLVISLTS